MGSSIPDNYSLDSIFSNESLSPPFSANNPSSHLYTISALAIGIILTSLGLGIGIPGLSQAHAIGTVSSYALAFTIIGGAGSLLLLAALAAITKRKPLKEQANISPSFSPSLNSVTMPSPLLIQTPSLEKVAPKPSSCQPPTTAEVLTWPQLIDSNSEGHSAYFQLFREQLTPSTYFLIDSPRTGNKILLFLVRDKLEIWRFRNETEAFHEERRIIKLGYEINFFLPLRLPSLSLEQLSQLFSNEISSLQKQYTDLSESHAPCFIYFMTASRKAICFRYDIQTQKVFGYTCNNALYVEAEKEYLTDCGYHEWHKAQDSAEIQNNT